MARPRVSIGLPVFQGERFLGEALESLLGQTFGDFELLVRDNASTDATGEIAWAYAERDPRVRYARNERNLGAIPNYDLVLREARGELFKWAAHDDRCEPRFLERCVEALDREPSAVLCHARARFVDAGGAEIRLGETDLAARGATPGERALALLRREIRSNDVFWAVFGVARTEALRRAGGLGRYVASDQVLLFELALRGEILFEDEPLFARRVHAEASTVKPRGLRERHRWYDETAAPRLVLPNWRLWREHLDALRRAGLDPAASARVRRALARRFARRWRRLAYELLSVPAQLAKACTEPASCFTLSRRFGGKA